MTTQPARSRATLTDISSRAWEHPADRGALVALRKLKGFDTLLKAMSGLFNERAVRLVYLGSAVRADDRQFTRLHRLLSEVGWRLKAEPRAPRGALVLLARAGLEAPPPLWAPYLPAI